MKQKYTIGQPEVWLREISETAKPIQEVEIIGFEPKNENAIELDIRKKGIIILG